MSNCKIVVEVIGMPREELIRFPGIIPMVTMAIQDAIAQIEDFEVEKKDIFCYFELSEFRCNQRDIVFFRYSATSAGLLDGGNWKISAHTRVAKMLLLEGILIGVNLEQIS